MELHNFWTQVFFPILFGGTISLLRYTFQKESSTTRGKSKHFMSGSLAGIVAVNMFNPKGTFDQVVVISVFAATHGIAWILANSFVSSKNANDIIHELQKEYRQNIDLLLEQDISTEDAISKVESLIDETIMKDQD